MHTRTFNFEVEVRDPAYALFPQNFLHFNNTNFWVIQGAYLKYSGYQAGIVSLKSSSILIVLALHKTQNTQAFLV